MSAEVALRKFKPAPTPIELPEADAQLDRVNEMKDLGNKWFKLGDLERAKRRYRGAVTFADVAKNDNLQHASFAARTNLAQVALKEKDYHECIDQCQRVLAKEPTNVKALYRRGIAKMELEDYDMAKLDLQKALELTDQRKPIEASLRDCEKRRKKRKSLDQKKFGGLFEKLGGFASEDRSQPKTQLPLAPVPKSSPKY